ncbi:single-stranded-DNA-specific exonuclease RecJ [Mediterraneibacter butyricigenes]|uniref:Single-stranded-DNA-specific exonuclease RecJ n=1 Tax=Mediterraneibacter butyricigenes TaxID=2316025 RepID=A0A391NZG5_9FIRM|nr:single-stranded-DNA-specific exonuclease RecJ [Mediterraneibacter butyricigenes]GCA65960.1 single-stranded-DNA-specific exonuclease RecJ [Mediterraneibacter butyricigenes]
MEKWFLTMKKADFQEIAGRFHISPITARLIRNKDLTTMEEIDAYLNGTISDLYDGMLMKDMDRAIEILSEKIREKQKIRVIGDYDIDGINATYILQEGLVRLGAEVDTDIPDRIRDGYGLNRLLIDRAISDGVDTVITCDNGIAAKEEIAYGKKLGLTVVVTDHHEVPFTEVEGEKQYQLPPADAVIDPKRVDCPYPFDGLCGAGVAYKLVEALTEAMGEDSTDLDDLMENVAIATIGDVMDLVDENRIFVRQGLEMLKRTKNLGLRALMECTNIPKDGINPYHIGFILGPCLNASGRLDTAKRALELLEAKELREAMVLAEDLKVLNDSRKELTEKGVKEAMDQIEASELKQDKVLVVYLPECHESIAGIIAGRIREHYSRPTLVLTKAETGVKGSGRSIEAYDMFTELNRCRDLFLKFGGHKMAAGVSLPEENVEILRKRLNENCILSWEDMAERIHIDMKLPFAYINEDLIREFSLLAPFGKGNTRPLFAEKNLRVYYPQIVGKNQNVLKFQVQDPAGNRMEAIYFGEAKKCLEYIQRKQEMAFTFYPSINEYNGRRTIQLTVVNYQ